MERECRGGTTTHRTQGGYTGRRSHRKAGPDGRGGRKPRGDGARRGGERGLLPATGPDRAHDPVVSFAGGPGDSAVEEAGFLASQHAELHKRRDFVLVDLRGTGGSAPLLCKELMGERGVQGMLDDFLPAAAVRSCRADHAGRDLAQYRTAAAVDDVAEVLTALGYDHVVAIEPAGDRLRLSIEESGGKVSALRLIGMAAEPEVLKRQ